MHSNFVTPPDYIETVLVLNASEEMIVTLGDTVKSTGRPYNIYFYRDDMDNQDWLDRIKTQADVILDAKLNSPLEYFNK
jgi:hypothetical protein